MKKIILLACCLILSSTYVWSCSCIFEPMNIKTLFEADYVFKGKVIKKETVGNAPKDSPDYNSHRDQFKYTFEIDEVIKGNVSKNRIAVFSSTQGSMCGINLSENVSYYLYAYSDGEGNYSTNLCTHTSDTQYANKLYRKIIRRYKRSAKIRKKWKYASSKKIAAKGKMKNQLPHGEWTHYHEDMNSSLKAKGNYINGMKDGKWAYYHDSQNSKRIVESLEVNEGQFDNRPNKDNLLYKYEIYEKGVLKEEVEVISLY